MDKIYDYIVIGAGSSGCVMANRLSADPAISVLLLEAGGPDKHPYIHIPGAYPKNHKSKRDWGFWTIPQKHLNQRKLYLPRGKVLGGCSSTNAMAYVRGNKHDFDHWAALGNPGWSYEEVLPMFIKSENNQHIDELEESYHGTEGELKVSLQHDSATPFAQIFIDSCQALGIQSNQDYNGRSQKGASHFQFTIADGKRQSSAVSFLKPVMDRSNLTVITQAHVTKIHVHLDEVTGISFKRGSTITDVSVDKEVILCAGAFQSPQLLMLSGIGPRDHLRQAKVELVHELPGVGQNLQDHLFYGVSALTKLPEGMNHHLSIPGQLKGLWSYYRSKAGPLMRSPLEAGAFLNIDDPTADVNFQIHFAPISFGEGYEYDVYDVNSYPHQDGISVLPTLLHPCSRGEVIISSADPMSPPVIDPKFLSEEKDLEQLVKGGKLALDIIRQAPFAAKLRKIIAPLQNNSEAGIIDHIEKSVETVYHPVGTCKMGHDELSVVDHELKVYGIGKLRVVDASIMPTIVSGNTNAACVMIAENAARIILS